MYEIIKTIHSWWAYLTLILLLVAFVAMLKGFFSKETFSLGNRKVALFALIGVHTQILFGIILYFVSPLGFNVFGNSETSVMKIAELRLTAVEHPAINLIAAVLVTVGWSMHKRKSGSEFKILSIYYGIAFLLILSRIPWKLWL